MNSLAWRWVGNALAVTILGLCAIASAAQEPEDTQTIPFLPSATDALGRLGIVRIINYSDEAGEVRIDAIDDEGQSYGPATLSIGVGESMQFNSDDLENGDTEKGLPDGVGPGEGAWRLELTSGLDIEVLSYVRSADGRQGLRTAADDSVGRCILAGDLDPGWPVSIRLEGNVQGFEHLLHPGSIQADCQHATGAGPALLQRGAMKDQARRVGEREGAAGIGRGNLAGTVARSVRWPRRSRRN